MDLASHAENKTVRGAASLHAINGGLSKPTSLLEPPTVSQVRETVVASRSTAPESQKQPVEVKQESAPIEEKTSESSEISEIEKVKNALITLALKNGLTNEELDAYAEFKLRQPLNAESDYSRLQRLYGDLKARLEKDKTGMKTRCIELMKKKAISQNGPEVEGMWEEFKRLADNNDILPEHMQAHLIELTGLAPENMNLETLQNAYREVEKRINSNLEAFKKETVNNYNSLLQKAA